VPRRAPKPWWNDLPTEELLDVRLCDLGLSIRGSVLADRVAQLRSELAQRGLKFRPRCWLSDDWFAPEGIPGIAIPFYLAHPRLMKIEDRHMFEVEGGTRQWCMRLLRHEAGHAIETAFRLGRRKRWRELFGSKSEPYPESYRPEPFSRDYVIHLEWWYAQSHPSEDFAETFAVWLTPGSEWRTRYINWPAVHKLSYVDYLMSSLERTRPPVVSRATLDPISGLRHTIREHYERKKERYGIGTVDVFDRDLRRLFSDGSRSRKAPAASVFLRRIGPELRARVSAWTGDLVLRDMITRCREMKLRATRPPGELKTELTVYLTMQTMNYLHSRDHRLVV
jgi:hypothetical protein